MVYRGGGDVPMRAEELRQLLDRRPCIPIRLHFFRSLLTRSLPLLLVFPAGGWSQSLPAIPATSEAPVIRPSPEPPAADATPAPSIAFSFHGIRFEEAWIDLAGRLGVVSRFDDSVTAAHLDERIRMDARHLDGAQALRWLGRLAGLVVVERQGVWLVASPEALPRVWQRTLPGPVAVSVSLEGILQGAPQGSPPPDIDWLDAPLSRVARDVAEGYRLDMVFAPELQSLQPMITATLSHAALRDVLEEIQRQLAARMWLWDGALWVQPADALAPSGVDEPAPLWKRHTSDGQQEGDGASETQLPVSSIHIDQRQDSWQAFAERLQTPGMTVRLEISPGHAWPGMLVRGTAREILTAAALLDRLEYQQRDQDPDAGPILVIRTRPR